MKGINGLINIMDEICLFKAHSVDSGFASLDHIRGQ